MSELRNAMIDQMLLKGYSERTKESYLSAVSLLARHYHRPPDKITHEDIQNWFLYLVKKRNLSCSTCRLYLNGLRFFYLNVLHWKSLQCEFNVPKTKQRIPDLLSVNDVRSIIKNTSHKKYRTLFILCYACGLRVSELVALKVKHIHGDEYYLQVVQGKGFKDRNIPLPHSVLKMLRDYWLAFRPEGFLFPGRDDNTSISITSVQKYYTKTKALAEITKVGGIHGLRHAFATHQLASGMPIHQLKNILGHTDLKSTERYLHWCPETAEEKSHFDLYLTLQRGE
ncbi:MAG: site-specific integrase [Woeseiaceae bacterium]